MTPFRTEFLRSSGNDAIPYRMLAFLREWRHSVQNSCVPQGMTPFRTEFLRSSGNGAIPYRMLPFLKERRHSVQNACVPQGMAPFHWAHDSPGLQRARSPLYGIEP